jgi:hypothetical protein
MPCQRDGLVQRPAMRRVVYSGALTLILLSLAVPRVAVAAFPTGSGSSTRRWPCKSSPAVPSSSQAERPCPNPAMNGPWRTFSGLPEPLDKPNCRRLLRVWLGVRERNDALNVSPNGVLSPALGGCPIYSTSFFGSHFRGLVSLAIRKVGIPFACCCRRWSIANRLTRSQPRRSVPKNVAVGGTTANTSCQVCAQSPAAMASCCPDDPPA